LRSKSIPGVLAFVALGTCMACLGGNCEGDDNSSSSLPPPVPVTIRGFWPCIGPAGTQVTVFRTPNTLSSIMFAGVLAQSSNPTETSVVATVPTHAVTGSVSVVDGALRNQGVSSEPFTVGIDDLVPEIEPNEDINGADATPMGPRTRGTGTLNGPGDRDHFRRGCFMTGARYWVTVTPRVTDTVFVNGTGVALDANGRGEFVAAANSLLFGMTGGNGDYTMTIGFVSP